MQIATVLKSKGPKWKLFVRKVCLTLEAAGIDAENFVDHSFQIGAKSMATVRGIEVP